MTLKVRMASLTWGPIAHLPKPARRQIRQDVHAAHLPVTPEDCRYAGRYASWERRFYVCYTLVGVAGALAAALDAAIHATPFEWWGVIFFTGISAGPIGWWRAARYLRKAGLGGTDPAGTHPDVSA